MEDKATIIYKRKKEKGLLCSEKFFLGVKFHNMVNTSIQSNLTELKVSALIFFSSKEGDNILVPFKKEEEGFVFDLERPITKL